MSEGTFSKSDLGNFLSGQPISFKYKGYMGEIVVRGFLDKVTKRHCYVGLEIMQSPEGDYDVFNTSRYALKKMGDEISYDGCGDIERIIAEEKMLRD
ncbi:MAG: hypothetical protein KC506_02290 [Nanoarchaeota archaeon]|nr:hypothetical protein [Nanoarchaeota archaeon]